MKEEIKMEEEIKEKIISGILHAIMPIMPYLIVGAMIYFLLTG